MLMANIFKPIRWLHAPPSERDSSSAAAAAIFQSGVSRESRVGTQPVTNTSPSGLSNDVADAFAGTYAAGTSSDGDESLVGSVAGSWDAAKEPAASPEEDAWLALLELVFDETGWPDADAE